MGSEMCIRDRDTPADDDDCVADDAVITLAFPGKIAKLLMRYEFRKDILPLLLLLEYC